MVLLQFLFLSLVLGIVNICHIITFRSGIQLLWRIGLLFLLTVLYRVLQASLYISLPWLWHLFQLVI